MKNIKKFDEFLNEDIKLYFDVEEGICPKCGSDKLNIKVVKIGIKIINVKIVDLKELKYMN